MGFSLSHLYLSKSVYVLLCIYAAPWGSVLCTAKQWAQIPWYKELGDCILYFPSSRKFLAAARSEKNKKQKQAEES